jgi:hypothetical protein
MKNFVKGSPLLVAAIVAAACSDAATSPTAAGGPPGISADHVGPRDELAHVEVCKVGTPATFDVDVDGTKSVVTLDGTSVTDCAIVATVTIIPGAPSPPITVTVTERALAGTYLDFLYVEEFFGANALTPVTLPGVNTFSRTFNDDSGFILTFNNAFCTGEIGDFVWDDADGDGLQDAGEVGIAGVTVNLKDGAGVIIATTVTDANGLYLFSGLCAGDYEVMVDETTVPAGWTQTPTLVGADPTIDNNPNPFAVTLPGPTTSDLTIDFGYIAPPVGGEGCTPGYWKNHAGLLKKNGDYQKDSWAGTGYAVGDLYDATFGVTSSFGGTLIEALNRGGGGENALGRHAVAALLNAASSVSYMYTPAQVIAAVQAAYASGDFEGTKNDFAYENEMGCPLN